MEDRRRNLERVLTGAMCAVALVFFALHFVHLRADFPNGSPWDDWSKYTDEGWYGDGAIRHYLRGTWRLPGDFNPAVALPVWPLLESVVFRFTGVGIAAARALTVCVFGGVLLCGFLLVRLRTEPGGKRAERGLFAAAAVLLLAASPFAFVFTRIAILEPLLILLTLLALLAAYRTRAARTRWQWIAYPAALGLLIALMVGTKTTAIFLLPAVFYMLWSSTGWHLRRMVTATCVCGLMVGLLWGVYLAVLVHAGLLGDFRYLFSANAYTGITLATFWDTVSQVVADGMWMGWVYVLAGLVLMASLLHRAMWRDAVFVSLLLWASGYLAFMVYHANFQPRYYLVVAVPLTLLAARGLLHLAEWQSATAWVGVPVILLLVAGEAQQTVGYVRHPEYTYADAAHAIEQIVESEPAHSHTVLSISGSDLSLMTGLPSICDDFGTMQLEDRVAAYKPGWFVAWNYVEDDKMAALTKFYDLTRVAELPAMDDPDRNELIVYRLDARQGIVPQRKHPGQRMLPTGGTVLKSRSAR